MLAISESKQVNGIALNVKACQDLQNHQEGVSESKGDGPEDPNRTTQYCIPAIHIARLTPGVPDPEL